MKVGFASISKPCCAQMAEALGNHFASDVFDSYVVEIHQPSSLNQDVVRLMKDLYAISLQEANCDKRVGEIDMLDVVIMIDDEVVCLPTQYSEHWSIEDPTGKSDEEVIAIIQAIEEKIFELKQTLEVREAKKTG